MTRPSRSENKQMGTENRNMMKGPRETSDVWKRAYGSPREGVDAGGPKRLDIRETLGGETSEVTKRRQRSVCRRKGEKAGRQIKVPPKAPSERTSNPVGHKKKRG